MQYKTPGVYIQEQSAYTNLITEVPTSVPAFIGYTPQAKYEGQDFTNTPVKITSFAEFEAYFAYPNPAPPAPPAVQYAPQYYLAKQQTAPEKGSYFRLNGEIYTMEPDPNTIYYLYNAIRLFYENGGGLAYIVSIGTYGPPSGKPAAPGTKYLNRNVALTAIQNGLGALRKEDEPTMYIVPEGTLLSEAEYGTLIETMLLQNQEMQTAVSILDIKGGREPDPIDWMEDIQAFRENSGTNGLSYGVAYYPWLETTIVQSGEFSYMNLNGGDVSTLRDILSPTSAPNPDAESILTQIENDPTAMTVVQYNNALINASQTYSQIMTILQGKMNTLPPSSAMAGVYTVVDSSRGIWHAPANVAPVGVSGLTLQINEQQQENLNVDAVSGKSVNAIRFFTGQGILVWGARTLDGNSQDWRYVNVRRLMIMLEQSIKAAARDYVFEPNDAKTWAAITAAISNFLTNLWKQGALQGAKPEDAFSVAVGLGSTMTAQDILDGYMRVTVKVAPVRPAEFIVITFEQQMPKS